MNIEILLIVGSAIVAAVLLWQRLKKIRAIFPAETVNDDYEPFDLSTNTMHCPTLVGISAKVVETLVKVGDEINDGDSLLLVESELAKMEIPSPIKGIISEVLVKEGQTIMIKDPLVRFSQTN